jgi:putative transposase
VYGFFARWRVDGTWLGIHDARRGRVRVAAGREPTPAIIGSRSVCAAATVGKDGRGFDAGNYAEQRIMPGVGLKVLWCQGCVVTSAA